MGRRRGRKYGKGNFAPQSETADGKVSETSSTMAVDGKEKRIFDLLYMREGKYQQILNELSLQKIDGEDQGVVSVNANFKDLPIITAEPTAKPLKSYSNRAAVVGLDSRIYSIGGSCSNGDGSLGEWHLLRPLADFDAYGPVAPMNVVLDDPRDARNKLILVHIEASKTLYAYNVRKNDWAPFDEEFGSAPAKPLYGECKLSPVYAMCATNAVVGDFLYCYSNPPGRFFAYHLKQKVWYHVPGILDILESDRRRFRTIVYNNSPKLFHLGGNTLCFLWCYSCYCLVRELPGVVIGCAKFKVEFDEKEAIFSVTEQRLGYFDHKVDATYRIRYALL
ncbi:Kelch-type beta propeller [Corchorus olitorius]|uniref:Kelch-type beta propeller n=1 Tax=Corchorus olitorius TaxID=93759 RepID=A0A1R3KRC1_9ROSI|nr:Kelch-type beta propeller [Corchorus olitorius]